MLLYFEPVAEKWANFASIQQRSLIFTLFFQQNNLHRQVDAGPSDGYSIRDSGLLTILYSSVTMVALVESNVAFPFNDRTRNTRSRYQYPVGHRS